MIRDINMLFGQEEDYFKLIRVDNFWKNNYIKYESNDNKDKNLSVNKYHNEMEPYSKIL